MPARLSLQTDFYTNYAATLSEQYPNTNFDVNWAVALEALSYPDNPNHEEGMPWFLESSDRYTSYTQVVDNNADADVNAELDKLQADLQASSTTRSNQPLLVESLADRLICQRLLLSSAFRTGFK